MSFILNKESFIDLSAGWCSGAAAVICCQPVDTILTRRQAGSKYLIQAGQQLVVGNASSVAASTATAATTSTTTRALIAQVGIAKLWRGALPMIGAVPFQNALLMAGYGLGKRYGQEEGMSSTSSSLNQNNSEIMNNNNKSNDTSNSNNNQYWGIFVGGCTGGVLQSFLMSPVELVKVQLRHTNSKNNECSNSNSNSNSNCHFLI
jgi:solute carrier family 25 (mitochondrial carnitine/acylcarnitine transporter), member 20/29